MKRYVCCYWIVMIFIFFGCSGGVNTASSDGLAGSDEAGEEDSGEAGDVDFSDLLLTAPGDVGADDSFQVKASKGAKSFDLLISQNRTCEDPVIELLGLGNETITVRITQPGTYSVCLFAYDKDGNRYAAKNNGKIIVVRTVNEAPEFAFVQPSGLDDFVDIGSSFSIQWTLSDVDSNAELNLYYGTDPDVGDCSEGTQIGSAILEDSGTTSLSWDTTGLAAGAYYICATAADAINDAVVAVSDQIVVSAANTCVWSGLAAASNNLWSESSNWSGCPGAGAPTSTDKVLVVDGRPLDPTIDASVTIDQFAEGLGGGTVTVDSAVTLTLSNTSASLASSVTFQGSYASCGDCRVRSSGNFYVVSGATLTLGTGISLAPVGHGVIYVGDGSTAGHLATVTADADSNNWPSLQCPSCQIKSVIVEGVAGSPSSVLLDGLNMVDMWRSQPSVIMQDYWTVEKFDRVYIDRVYTDDAYADYIDFASCTNATFNDTSFEDIQFLDGWRTVYKNINASDASCSGMSSLTVSGSGPAYGVTYEGDAHDKITWQ